MVAVRFPRKGFYHPAFGRLGVGEDADTIYDLPDNFADPETLPKGTEIIEDPDELDEALDENEQKAPAKVKLASDAKETMPAKKRKTAQAGAKKKPTAVEKTTGGAAPRRRRRAAPKAG